MTRPHPTFVFVHGAWHDSRSWTRVQALLDAQGYPSVAVDLPGATSGLAASQPSEDGTAGASETAVSPVSGITQAQRTEAVVQVVRDLEARDCPVILVGHSMGGATISPVTEQIPEAISAVVYLSGFMVPPGMTVFELSGHASMADALTGALFVGDPEVLGALRIQPDSPDESYQQTVRSAFYGDVDESDLEEFIQTLHSDEPVSASFVPSDMTAERFGSVPRYYIECSDDRAIPPSGQAFMMAEVDRALGGRPTKQLTLQSSHSSFLSQPGALADLLVGIAEDV